MLDTVAIGSLFLFSAVVSAYFGDASFLGQGQVNPISALATLAAGAGVGGFLTLAGSAIWNLFWPYNPEGGIRRWLPRWGRNFREAMAPSLHGYYHTTADMGLHEGDRALISTSYPFYAGAPDPIVQWVRRRHDRFRAALSSVMAIALGIVLSEVITPAWPLARLAVVGVLLVVAVLTFFFALGQRHEGEHMEEYWLRLPVVLRDGKGADSLVPEPVERYAHQSATSETPTRPIESTND